MINLVNPRSPFLISENVMPPLGLMYLSAVLKKAGIEAKISDMGLGDPLPQGDNLFVTGTTPQLPNMLEIAKSAPKGCWKVVGGPHASAEPESLKDCFDVVVTGEAEGQIAELARNLGKNPGLVRCPKVEDLDALPFPDRSTINRYKYTISGEKATTLLSSRGCNGACAFCAKMHARIRLRSVNNVLAEVDEIMGYGYKALMFYDDNIAMDRQRLEGICHGLRDRNIIWRCLARADHLPEELLAVMAKCGCQELLLGAESGSQRLLDNINKGETVDSNVAAALAAKKHGIRVKFCLIVGLPGENRESIDETRAMLHRAQPDDMDLSLLNVYPGSAIHRHPDRYDLKFGHAVAYKGRPEEMTSTVSTSALSAEEITEAYRELVEEFKGIKLAHGK